MATLGATTVTSLKASGAMESSVSLKAPTIYLGKNDITTVFAGKAYEKTITDHINATSGNPHGVTKTEVGLGSVRNVEQYSKKETDDKLDTKINIANGVATTSLTIEDPASGAVSIKFIRKDSSANDWTITDTGGYFYIYSDANGTAKSAVKIDPSETNGFRTTLSALTVGTVKFEDKITNPKDASNGKILKIAGGVPTWGTDYDHIYKSGTYITVATKAETDGTFKVSHNTSGVTAGSYGLTATVNDGKFGDGISVPYVTVDAQGHITVASTNTYKIPDAVATKGTSVANSTAGLMSAKDKFVFGDPVADTYQAIFIDSADEAPAPTA